MRSRLMEVEKDRLIKKYAHHFVQKEAKIARFFDILQGTDVWSSSLRQGYGGAHSDLLKDAPSQVSLAVDWGQTPSSGLNTKTSVAWEPHFYTRPPPQIAEVAWDSRCSGPQAVVHVYTQPVT